MSTPRYAFPGATNRGVHLQPFGFHEKLVAKFDEHVRLLKKMHMSYVVIISEGDSVLRPLAGLGGRSVVQAFLDNEIVPVVRFAVKLNYPWPHMDHVRELVRQFNAYGLDPMVLVGNEPGDGREYSNGIVPSDWAYRYVRYFCKYGTEIVNAGAVALFADGPGYPFDPFPMMSEVWPMWLSGWMGYAGHFYGLNRPPDWPYDSVLQTGKPLVTEADARAWFGPFYNDRGLNDVPVWEINQARGKPRPGLTAIQDPTCWRGWEQVAHWMTRHFGKPLLIVETEGGWTPGAHAGSGANRDKMYFKPTPIQVAEFTLYSYTIETPMLFQAHWLLGDSVLGGSGAWDMDAWLTGWWRHGGIEFWYYMPVIEMLMRNPPIPQSALPALLRKACNQLIEMRALLEQGL